MYLRCVLQNLFLLQAGNSLRDRTTLAYLTQLTHWGRFTHLCVCKLTNIGSDNGLSPGRRRAIILPIDAILLFGHLETNFTEILIAIQAFSFKIMHLKMSSGRWRLLSRPQRVNSMAAHVPVTESVITCIYNEPRFITKWGHFAEDILKCIFLNFFMSEFR